MRDRDAELLVIGGLLVMLALRKPRQVPAAAQWGSGWYLPVPDLITAGVPPYPSTVVYPATVTQEFREDHLGVDIAYRRIGPTDRPEMTGENTCGPFFAPQGTPILAARAGRVWSVDRSARGIEVVIDHGKPWSTYYQHLATSVRAVGATVNAGDVIGYMGFDPTDPQRFRHLHFAVWFNGSGNDAAVNPMSAMSAWKRSTWKG